MHPVLQQFQRDTAEHLMEVLHDDGIYRHLRFSRAHSGAYHFALTTWPGYLCISGDMGCFTFSRISDMFEFFRDNNSSMGINPSYWAQKLESGASTADRRLYMEWDGDAFVRAVVEEYKAWLESGALPEPDTTEAVKDEIRNEILEKAEFEEVACMAVSEFYCSDASGLFQDFLIDMGNSCHRYSFHYLWCCWAIVHGIAEYDKLKAKVAA